MNKVNTNNYQSKMHFFNMDAQQILSQKQTSNKQNSVSRRQEKESDNSSLNSLSSENDALQHRTRKSGKTIRQVMHEGRASDLKWGKFLSK